MKNFLVEFAKTEGFCCPWAFITQLRRYRSSQIAKVLGVDKSTVKRWRRALKRGELRCLRGVEPGWPPCQRQLENHPTRIANLFARKYPGSGGSAT